MQLEKFIKVDSTPAKINFNYEDLKKLLDKELERFDIKVTEDTLADAKKLCTELNQSKLLISKVRKFEIEKVSGNIKTFDEKMKDFEVDVAHSRSKLLDQVAFFEEERKSIVHGLLVDYRLQRWQELGLRDEFQHTEIEDLVIISNATPKNNLTAKAKSAVDQRVEKQRQIQDATDRRLLELENVCLRAGLTEPLQRAHVESFLFQDEDTYKSKLENLISIETEREERAEKTRKAKADKLKAQQQADTKPEVTQPEPLPETTPTPAPKAVKAAPKNGKIKLRVVCEFDIEVSQSTPFATIENAYRSRIEQAGFKTLSRVLIEEQ